MFIARLFYKNKLFNEFDNKLLDEIDWNVVMHILLQNKNCAKLQNFLGQYPLHLACEYYAPEDIVFRIIDLYPDAAQCKDNYLESYPLHFACRSNQTDNVVLKLIDMFPHAVQFQDKNGLLPLHCACVCKAPLSIIKLLVLHYPVALEIRDNDSKTPLDWAACFPIDETVVEWLNSVDGARKLVPGACYMFLKNYWMNASSNSSTEDTTTTSYCADITTRSNCRYIRFLNRWKRRRKMLNM